MLLRAFAFMLVTVHFAKTSSHINIYQVTEHPLPHISIGSLKKIDLRYYKPFSLQSRHRHPVPNQLLNPVLSLCHPLGQSSDSGKIRTVKSLGGAKINCKFPASNVDCFGTPESNVV